MKRCLALALLMMCNQATAGWAGQDASVVNYTEGVFQISLPVWLTRMPTAKQAELKRTLVQGGKELTRTSGIGDPKHVSEMSSGFVSGFENTSRKVMLLLIRDDWPLKTNIDEMMKANQQRVKWGMGSGRLKPSGKGVSKLSVNNIPTLLLDIELQTGGRMQHYQFFLPEQPLINHTLMISCENLATFNAMEKEISDIVGSLRIDGKK